MSTPTLIDAIGQELSPADVVAYIKHTSGGCSAKERTITNIDPYNRLLSLDGGQMKVKPHNVVRIQSPWERTCYV